MAHDTPGRGQDIVLKGGLLVDGTGQPPVTGNLLIRAGRIHRISARAIRTTGVVIDCAGRVVAPGFIDAHSHLDWHAPVKGHDELKYPFLAQGVTTVVAGNCGLAAAGFREGSAWKERIGNTFLASGHSDLPWDTVRDYLARLASSGASHNIALLAGHGSTRASIRGNNASPLHPYETKELLWLLESAMDQGAKGISLGLQHVPGMFARAEEMREVALLAKRKGKVLAVHLRAFSAFAPGEPVRSFREARAFAGLRESLDLARSTGVRLQLSNLLFCAARTWRSAEAALGLIDAAIADGVDVRYSLSPFHSVATTIGVLLPVWFHAQGSSGYEDTRALRKLKREIRLVERRFGIAPGDIQIVSALDPDASELNGRYLHEVSRLRRMSHVDTLIDIARQSGGQARVLFHKCGNDRIVEALARHSASLFATESWVERAGVQNPSAFGCYPRLLRMVREKRLLALEEAVRKMSGAAAERFGLTGRGVLKEGYAADIVVFDWENVQENEAAAGAGAPPSGIEYVFVNGKKIIGSGRKENPLNAGVPLA
jgi:N-acyl-D-aspartate/D-glutamate deacylase